MTDQNVTILLVEDDEVDVKSVQRGLKKLKVANAIRVARDGIEALEILRGENGREQLVEPYLILLDLNMPRMGGLEFLDVLREDEELSNSIVFVMTTSSADEDRVRAYDRNVAGYIAKANAGPSFIHAVEMLDHFWRIIEFPPPRG